MTPTDILTAARANPLSPIVPAREEWLKDWIGPARDGQVDVPVVVLDSFGPTCLVYGTYPSRAPAEWEVRVDRIRLDLHRREVRHRLVDCGAPGWCMESVAGMLGWALTGSTADGLSVWCSPEWRTDGLVSMRPRIGASLNDHAGAVVSDVPHDSGWLLQPRTAPFSRRHYPSGPETGPEGRACADLAALRAGCVLTEPDGWYIPLPGGAVGWLPKESA